MKIWAAVAAATLTLTGVGCEAGTQIALRGGRAPRVETQTFTVEHLSADHVRELLSPYVYDDRETNPGTLSVAAGAVTVRETTDNLERIGRVLETYDVQARTVRLRFQLIEANGASGAPDPAIAQVVEELRSLFRFEGYRLLGETVVAAADASVSQEFPGLPYLVQADVSQLPDAMRLDDLRLWEAEPGGTNYTRRILTTGLTIPMGHTVVIGSAQASDGAGTMILTVRAEDPGAGRP